VNTDSQPRPFGVSFSNNDGQPLSLPLGADGDSATIQGTVAPAGLRVIQTDGSNSSLVEGWGNIQAANSIGGTGIFTAQSGGRPPSEAAVPLNVSGSQQLYLPFDQTTNGLSYATGIALANLAGQDAVAVLTFVDDVGNVIPISGSITVPANGHYAVVLGDVFPAIQGKRGVAKITSNVNLSGLGIRFNGAAFTSIAALSSVAQGSKTITHLANGTGWKTTIQLVNTDTQPAPFTLRFYNSDGTPLVLPLGSDGVTSSISGTIAPGQLRVIQTDGSGDALVQGSAILDTAFAIGGTAIFTAQSHGQPPSEAAVPLVSVGSAQLFLPFDQTSTGFGFATGIALANPGPTAATVTLSFTDEMGQTLLVNTPITIAAHGHYSAVLGSAFPSLQGKRGVARVNSSVGLTGLGIRFNGAAYTSLPAIAPAAN